MPEEGSYKNDSRSVRPYDNLSESDQIVAERRKREIYRMLSALLRYRLPTKE